MFLSFIIIQVEPDSAVFRQYDARGDEGQNDAHR